MKFLCIIPARGGSKSLKIKNIKKINDIPLINFTIISALKSKIFDNIVVSTDNKKIKKNCLKFNKILTFDRRPAISKDDSTTEETVEDVLKTIKLKKNYFPDWIFILEPTSPLRSIRTIIKAKQIIKKNNKKINSLLSIKKISNTPAILRNNRLNYIIKRISQRQIRKVFYEESSTIYCVKYNFFKKFKKIVEKKPYVLLIPKIETIDINDSQDFEIAKKLILKK